MLNMYDNQRIYTIGFDWYKILFQGFGWKAKPEITTDMIAGYMHGDRVKQVVALLEGDKVSAAMIVNIRNFLALQIILKNFKRSADIRGLYVDDVINATVPEGAEFAELPES